jgi:alpha-tubulin suppressor-like RCC1 family protein
MGRRFLLWSLLVTLFCPVYQSTMATTPTMPLPPLQIIFATGGEDFYLAYGSDNVLYGFGDDSKGQLGMEDPFISDQYLTRMLKNPFGINPYYDVIYDMKSGPSHTIAVTKSNVYAFGGNEYGQSGSLTAHSVFNPLPIFTFGASETFKSLDVYNHNLMLTSSGLYGWGNNTKGQLGLGTYENVYTPRLINTTMVVGEIIYVATLANISVIISKGATAGSQYHFYYCGTDINFGVASNTFVEIVDSPWISSPDPLTNFSHTASTLYILPPAEGIFVLGSNEFGLLGVDSDLPYTNTFIQSFSLLPSNYLIRGFHPCKDFVIIESNQDLLFGFGHNNNGVFAEYEEEFLIAPKPLTKLSEALTYRDYFSFLQTSVSPFMLTYRRDILTLYFSSDSSKLTTPLEIVSMLPVPLVKSYRLALSALYNLSLDYKVYESYHDMREIGGNIYRQFDVTTLPYLENILVDMEALDEYRQVIPGLQVTTLAHVWELVDEFYTHGLPKAPITSKATMFFNLTTIYLFTVIGVLLLIGGLGFVITKKLQKRKTEDDKRI